MNYFLGLSVLLNLYFGYKILMPQKDSPKLERIILETHATEKKSPPPTIKKVPLPNRVKSDPTLTPPQITINSVDVTSLGETLEQDRQQFLEKDLTLPPDKIKRHNELRTEFQKTISRIFATSPDSELPLKQRRLLLDLEDKLNTDLEKLYGKANWKRFVRFRENYNKQGMKRQREQNEPFLFMSP